MFLLTITFYISFIILLSIKQNDDKYNSKSYLSYKDKHYTKNGIFDNTYNDAKVPFIQNSSTIYHLYGVHNELHNPNLVFNKWRNIHIFC